MNDKVMTLPANGAKDTDAVTTMSEPTEKPVFDFSRTSYKDMRKVSRVQVEIQHLNKKISAAGADDDIVPLLDRLDELMDTQEENVLRPVKSVPRSWLVEDAPSDINWRENDALQWLRSDKFNPLVTAMTEAQSAKN